MHNQFQLVQQCIQISTRINSSMYIRTSSFVSLETPLHFIACIQQGFVDPKMQQVSPGVSYGVLALVLGN